MPYEYVYNCLVGLVNENLELISQGTNLLNTCPNRNPTQIHKLKINRLFLIKNQEYCLHLSKLKLVGPIELPMFSFLYVTK